MGHTIDIIKWQCDVYRHITNSKTTQKTTAMNKKNKTKNVKKNTGAKTKFDT